MNWAHRVSWDELVLQGGLLVRLLRLQSLGSLIVLLCFSGANGCQAPCTTCGLLPLIPALMEPTTLARFFVVLMLEALEAQRWFIYESSGRAHCYCS